MSTIAPVIEVYFDPDGFQGGKAGCYRARLRDAHGCHSANTTPEATVESLLLTIRSFAKPSDQNFADQVEYAKLPETIVGYDIVRLAPWTLKSIPMVWNARDEQQEALLVEDQRKVNEIVAYLLLPRITGNG